MRIRKSVDEFAVQAYAGTTGVLLAMNISEKRRKGLLGFAIERSEDGGATEMLCGMLHFPQLEVEPGTLIPTNEAPIQKFRWSDYRVHHDRDYTYRVHPVYGGWKAPEMAEPIEVSVKAGSLTGCDHRVSFNRAAAASQAFSRKFPKLDARMEGPNKAAVKLSQEALDWLSRGVREQIIEVIEAAKDSTFALDIAIYEYELDDIVKAIDAAHKRGVDVRVVYHAKPGDEQTSVNEENLKKLPKKRKRARITNAIFHDKFIVLSEMVNGERKPKAVLCGSTNFTENGVYRQANVVHVVHIPDVAAAYLAHFEFLFEGNDPAATRKHDTDENPMPDDATGLFVGFSPRSGKTDLTFFIEQIEAAKRDVLFSTAFDLTKDIYAALLGKAHDEILRFGIQNRRSTITGTHADRTANFQASAMLNKGLEGWLKESTAGQKGNILIHTKVVVVDFTTNAPLVISGSHNLSNNASANNDENYLVIRGNTDVADCYGIEVMRIYDHYRFRFVTNEKNRKPPVLTEDDSWTNRYFKAGSLHFADRVSFAGAIAKRAHG